MRKAVDMLSGSITKGIIRMAVPIMIMNVAQMLFNLIDLTMLKAFVDDSAVGSVGVSTSLISLCTSLLIGLSVGANVAVARRIGMGNRDHVENAIMTALFIAVVGGLLLMAVGAIFAKPFLLMIDCPQELLREAILYFRMYFFRIPFLMMYNFCAAILRAMGDTKRPMYILIIGGITKIVFTLLFVSVFKMRVAGVGASTIISNIVISILALRALNGMKGIFISIKKIKPHKIEAKEILYVGIPSGLQTAMYSFANVIIMSVVNSFGAHATTGISIANQFDGIMYHIIYAPSLAVVPYVSQNIGAGNIKRTREVVWKSVLITTVLGVLFGSMFAGFSRQLSSIMSDTPEVIAFSRQKMIIVSSTYFLCGINEIMGGAMKGMGKPVIPAVMTFIYMCLFRFLWVYVMYPLCPHNLTFLYLVWPIGWTLSIITLLVFYFKAVAQLQREQREMNFLSNRELQLQKTVVKQN